MAERSRSRRPGRAWIVIAVAVALAMSSGVAHAADGDRLAPRPTDRCPVCGMFVAKYPDFLAVVVYRDGSTAFFDGAKDMFKYLLDPGTHAPARRASDIAAIHVTDYYALSRIDARTAWYVVGSDVTGPMGHELIPFAREEEAREFMKDHRGRDLRRFHEVTAAVVKELR